MPFCCLIYFVMLPCEQRSLSCPHEKREGRETWVANGQLADSGRGGNPADTLYFVFLNVLYCH